MNRGPSKFLISAFVASCGLADSAMALLGTRLTFEETQAAEVVIAIEHEADEISDKKWVSTENGFGESTVTIVKGGKVLKGKTTFPFKVTGPSFLAQSTRVSLLFLKRNPDSPPGILHAVNRIDFCLETSQPIDLAALEKARPDIVSAFLKETIPNETNLELLARQARILRDSPLEVRRFCWEKIKLLSEEQRIARALPFLSIGLHAEGPAAFQFIPKTAWSVSKLGRKGTITETWSEICRTDIKGWAYRNENADFVGPILDFTEMQEGEFRSLLLRAVADASEPRHVPQLLEFLAAAESNQELWSAYYSIRQAIGETARTPAADGLKARRTHYLAELSEMLEPHGHQMPPIKLWSQP